MLASTADDLLGELVAIPAGEFVMGSHNELFGETPAHPVAIENGFLLGRHPVTQAQWLAVCGANPSTFPASPKHPVDNVSWDQAVEFCRRASERTGRTVRLPSEAEWEYACRAGTIDDFHFGEWGHFNDETELPWPLREALCDYAWFDLNSLDSTQPVGLKLPNPWGLHDMIGKVWEWCADFWHSDYEGAPPDGSPWTDGAERQPRRCLRGGAWDMNAFRCRSCYRSFDHRTLTTSRFGLRVVVEV